LIDSAVFAGSVVGVSDLEQLALISRVLTNDSFRRRVRQSVEQTLDKVVRIFIEIYGKSLILLDPRDGFEIKKKSSAI
jgi:hypothetical protein